MRTTFITAKSAPSKVGALVIPVGTAGAIPAGVGLNRSQLVAVGFEGKVGQSYVLAPNARGTVRVLVGIGVAAELTANTLRNIAATAARASAKFESVATTLPSAARGDIRANAQAVVEGFALA